MEGILVCLEVTSLQGCNFWMSRLAYDTMTNLKVNVKDI